MLRFKLLLVLVACFCLTGMAVEKGFVDSAVRHIDYPAWFNESPFLDLAEDLENARANGKKGLVVLFTTEGCSYCDAFIRKVLGDPQIADRVRKNFDVIGLEIFDDADMITPDGKAMSVKQFASNEKAAFAPTLLFYGEHGQRVLRRVGYQSSERFEYALEYVTQEKYRSESFRTYLKRMTAYARVGKDEERLKIDSLFGKPPYALNRSQFPASQPLLVIFEKSNCSQCDEFHSSVLSQKETRDALAKFEVVRFDANDSATSILGPGGKRTSPARWYEQASLTHAPAMLFFDEQGNEVLKIDSPALNQRFMNSVNFVLERAYEKGWTYQRFARTKGIERALKKSKSQ